MEITRHSRQAPSIAIHLRPPAYIRFMRNVCLACLVMVTGVMLLARFAQPPSNPFYDYASILPGQPRSALIQRGFSCAEGEVANNRPSPSTIGQYCVLPLNKGIFDRIGAVLSHDVVKQVFFIARKDALTVGDLALLWGRPLTISGVGEQITLDWPPSDWSILAITNGTRFSYLMPVHRVTFSTGPY